LIPAIGDRGILNAVGCSKGAWYFQSHVSSAHMWKFHLLTRKWSDAFLMSETGELQQQNKVRSSFSKTQDKHIKFSKGMGIEVIVS
jgi:hypothetical protein